MANDMKQAIKKLREMGYSDEEIKNQLWDKLWDILPKDDEHLTPEELEQLKRNREDKDWTSLEELKRELGFKN
ncbi:hypothetical protein JQC72_06805 [Polycladomyces sp. WAk]|uniref:Uncharacterized protein n=1 Tax=Polycladomyces zharkentensis TaxID=2807616 RepID=A0ABS2WID9_9BACL|nr:hypothetical protein [Polycladomyces sp. WAk]MBN2909230.1 hypothetical protein [Polycladomyces sp. WAk]